MNTTYSTFVMDCENIAKELHSVVDIAVYKKTGLAFISFMTEKFGDAYVHLHYDINANKIVHCFGLKKETEITDLPQLKEFVRIEHNKLMRNKQFRNKQTMSIDIDKEDKQ
jgi:hypothetical protein